VSTIIKFKKENECSVDKLEDVRTTSKVKRIRPTTPSSLKAKVGNLA
jgi:hypothetical protein